jgi:uncharacterized membrane protein
VAAAHPGLLFAGNGRVHRSFGMETFMEMLLAFVVILLVVPVLILQILLLRRKAGPSADLAPLLAQTEAVERAQERTERGLREEIGRNREEAARDAWTCPQS